MDVSRLNGPPRPWHLGFMLGPRINAGGRIGRADLGVTGCWKAMFRSSQDRARARSAQHRGRVI